MFILLRNELGAWLKWQSACPASTRPSSNSVLSPSPQKRKEKENVPNLYACREIKPID
jgi:hypothetical protein